jgi:N-acetylglucosamine-6-sulfatase
MPIKFLRLDRILFFILMCVLFSSCDTKKSQPDFVVLPKENRPNIIFIYTDDLDAKLNTIDYMKNLQELMVAQGTTWDDFFITNTLCCPSRTTALRGQYTHNHQVYNNTPPNGGFVKFNELGNGASTLGLWLQSAGYRTALMGKFLNGFPFSNDRLYMPPGWSEWLSNARQIPYAEYDYVLNENGVLVAYPPDEVNYFTDVLSRKANDFIQRAAADDVPFFIYLAPTAPHVPATPAARHLNLFPDATIPITPSFNEADVSDKPGNMKFNPLLDDGNISTLNDKYRDRIRSMQAVDEMIAALIKTLKQSGQLENTYIIFSSDNGFHLGQHRMFQGKGTLYEEDIMVPFIVRGPGISEGGKISGLLAGNVDFVSTIADWAGVTPPAFVDGRSLAGVLSGDSGKAADWRQAYLLEVYPEDANGEAQEIYPQENHEEVNVTPIMTTANIFQSTFKMPLIVTDPIAPIFSGLRTNQYLYVEHDDGFLELYDLIKDPYELENIAGSADPGLLGKFSAWLKDMSTCSGLSCRSIESRQLSP